jgi:hypothetical protein
MISRRFLEDVGWNSIGEPPLTINLCGALSSEEKMSLEGIKHGKSEMTPPRLNKVSYHQRHRMCRSFQTRFSSPPEDACGLARRRFLGNVLEPGGGDIAGRIRFQSFPSARLKVNQMEALHMYLSTQTTFQVVPADRKT